MQITSVNSTQGEWFKYNDIARMARPPEGETRRVKEARQAAVRYVLNTVNMAFRKTAYAQPVILGLNIYDSDGMKDKEELITISNLHVRIDSDDGTSSLMCIHRDALSTVQRMLDLCEAKSREGKTIRLTHKLA